MAITQTTIGAGTVRQPPFPNTPLAEVLIGAGESESIGVVHVTVPAGAAMGEHDHGASTVVLVPLTGTAELIDTEAGDQVTALSPGTVTVIEIGHRVRLENPSETETRLLVLLSPPDFAAQIEAWPVVPIAAAA